MGLMELLQKIRELRAARQEEGQRQDIPDDMTRDKYLRSLRRERRVQMEGIEKQQLRRDISEFRKEEERKNLWGVGGESRPITHQQFSILNSNQKKIMQQRMRFI